MQRLDGERLDMERPNMERLREVWTTPAARWAMLAAALLALCVAGALSYRRSVPETTRFPGAARVASPLSTPSADPPPVEPLIFRPLPAADAFALNAATPVIAAPTSAASGFRMDDADPIARARALSCLAAAIHYEAAGESDDSQAAVAQVVLNRLRHPSYPKSVCAVVFQGSERATGCQFSFTCDGAMARMPLPASWARARAAAAAALTGRVMPAVGWATHFHTQWVVPYWRSSLRKAAVIGAHIFYTMPPPWDAAARFAGRHAGAEPEILQMTGLGADAPLLAEPPAEVAAETAVPDPATPAFDAASPFVSGGPSPGGGNVAPPQPQTSQSGPPVPPAPPSTSEAPAQDAAPAATPTPEQPYFPSRRPRARPRLPV